MFKIFISLLLLIKLILSQQNTTVFQLICTDPKFSLLCNLTIQAGLDTALDDPAASLTLFAPNNDAIIALSQDKLNALNDTDTLRDVLLYHVFPNDTDPLTFPDGTVLEMLNNRNTTVNRTQNTVSLIDELGDESLLIGVLPNVINGFVQEITRVLIPDIFNFTEPINMTTTGIPINMTTTDIPINITTTDIPINITTTDAPVNITTTNVPVNTSAPTLAPTPIPLSEINRMAIEELELRVGALERQLSECNCKKDDSIDKGYKGGKRFRSKSRPSFSRRSSRRFSKFSYRGW